MEVEDRVLSILKPGVELTQEQLRIRTGYSQSYLKKMLADMVSRGLLASESGNDPYSGLRVKFYARVEVSDGGQPVQR